MSGTDDLETHIAVSIGVMRKGLKARLTSKLIEERDRAKAEMAREIADYLRMSFTFEPKATTAVRPSYCPAIGITETESPSISNSGLSQATS
jgi:hypothetical protein